MFLDSDTVPLNVFIGQLLVQFGSEVVAGGVTVSLFSLNRALFN